MQPHVVTKSPFLLGNFKCRAQKNKYAQPHKVGST